MPVNLCYGHAHIDADGDRRTASEKPGNQQNSTEEFYERRNVAEPSGYAEARHELCMMMKPAKNFVISVHHHDDSEHNPQHEECQGLNSIKEAEIQEFVLH